MQNNSTTGKYIVPISIVIAGIIIAGAVYFTRASSGTPSQAAQNQQAQAANTAVTITPVDPSKDHILGDPNAPIDIVEYSDAQCPFCRAFEPTMQQIMDTYGKNGQVAWVYRNFPLDSLHPDARRRALGLECAASLGGNDKFWSFEKALYGISDDENEGTPDLGAIAASVGIDETQFNSCLDNKTFATKVQDDEDDAMKAGGQGTPFNVLVFKNGVNDATKQAVQNLQAKYGPQTVYISDDNDRIVVGGALPLADMQSILDAATSQS